MHNFYSFHKTPLSSISWKMSEEQIAKATGVDLTVIHTLLNG